MDFLRLRSLLPLILMLITTLLISACQTLPPAGLTPQQIALLKDEGFVQNDDDWELNLSGKFLFDIDKDVLSTESIQALRRLARALLDVGIERVRVDGHTDHTGEKAYNQQLSERRATTVAQVLISSGMRHELVQIRGLGDTQPVTPGETRTDRRENRRVVVVVSSSAPD